MVGTTPQALYRNGLKLINRGRFDEAAAVFSAALLEEPNNAHYLMSRGECFVAMQDYDAAISDFESTLRLNDGAFQAHWGLARCMEAKDDLDGALSNYNNALELNPDFSDGYFNRGKLLHHLGQTQAALADFRQAYAKAILNRPDPEEFFRDMPEYIHFFNEKELPARESYVTRSLMELLHAIRQDPESEFADGASEMDIQRLQKALGITFPTSYVEFLKNFDGGEFRLVRMFSIAAERGFGRVAEQTAFLQNNVKVFADGILVPIGDDFGGNIYCFDVEVEQDGEFQIVRWNHENDDAGEPQPVADSFCEFLEFDLLGGDRQSKSGDSDRDFD
ncbi:MAG: SMI1/KNR4 family protein [Candidatus Obscuribacterales bacterium]|nr:SMI1/KNR4 family protein [Candidatus Obscuribacterales bacterium]